MDAAFFFFFGGAGARQYIRQTEGNALALVLGPFRMQEGS